MNPIFSLLLISLLSTSCIHFIPVPKFSQDAMLKNQKQKYERAVKTNHKSMLRDMCRNPFVYDKPPFQKWTDTVYSPKACEQIGGKFEDKYTSLRLTDKRPSQCLHGISKFIGEKQSTSKKSFEWQKRENLLAMVQDDVEKCLGKMEERHQKKDYGSFTQQDNFFMHSLLYDIRYLGSLSYRNLDERHVKRIDTLIPEVKKAYIDKYKGLLAKEKDPYIKVYLHAVLAQIYDKLDMENEKNQHIKSFTASYKSLATPNLFVKISGKGPKSKNIIKELKKEDFVGLVLSDKSDKVYSFDVSAPLYNSGTEKVQKVAEKVTVKRYMGENPEWIKQDKYCRVELPKKKQRSIDQCVIDTSMTEAECAKHKTGWKKAEEECARKLRFLRKEIEMEDKHIEKFPYSATEFYQEASGSFTTTYKNQNDKHPILVRASSFTHNGVPKAGLAANVGSIPSTDEALQEYANHIRYELRKNLSSLGSSFKENLLESAAEATSHSEAWKYTMQYIKVNERLPSDWKKIQYEMAMFPDIWKEFSLK